MTLIIRRAQIEDEHDNEAAASEFVGSGFDWSMPASPEVTWSQQVVLFDDWEHGRNLPSGWVPATTRFAVVDEQVVGRLSVRHELNEFLALAGGHIGYGVRPAFRRRGIATALLNEGLKILRDRGVTDVLVTCKDTNVGSATVIERAGGVLRDTIIHPVTNDLMRRYDFAG